MVIFFILALATFSLAEASQIAATVNGQPIMESEVKKRLSEQPYGESSRAKELDRLILYRLAVQQARKEGLEKNPETREKIDQVLYSSFLERTLARSNRSLSPTTKELEKEYQKKPLVRLRQLTLLTRTPEEKQLAKDTVFLVQRQLKAGTPFKELVLKHSQDQSARFAGDLDFRGARKLPPKMYEIALKLEQNEVSAPFTFGIGTHLIQRIGTKPYAQAPATYLSFLTRQIRKKRELTLLNSTFETLKGSSVVKIIPRSTPLP